MQPYNRQFRGIRHFSSSSGGSAVEVSAGSRYLSCPPLIRGNFKHPNPWSYTVVNNALARGYISTFQGGVEVERVSGQLWQEAVAFASTSDLKVICYNNCLDKLAEKARGSLDLATSIAEGGQTIKMLNLSDRLTSNLRSMSAVWDAKISHRLRVIKSRRGLKRALKAWERGSVATLPLARKYYRKAHMNEGFLQRVSRLGANGWLEFTYGWSPLMGDIYGIATNVVGRVQGLSNKFSVSSKEVINVQRSEDATTSYPPIIESAAGFVAVRVMASMKGSFDPGLAAWTSLNPLSVGYELLPYSFVVDWAFNIGQYLRNLETSMLFRTQYEYGYISTLIHVDYTYSELGRTKGVNTFNVANLTAKKSVTTFNRELSVSYPIPEVPKLNINLGSQRLLSAAALLRQLLR